MKRLLIAILFVSALALHAGAQKVTYSDDRSDLKQTNFEIIGKYGNDLLVYKNYRNKGRISVYDADMKLKENVPLDFLPSRVIETDFVAYPDYSYLFYQYQRKNIVYCMSVKIGADGKPLSQPIELDTTQLGGFNADNRIYSVIVSEDKQKIQVFKVNTRNEKRYALKTLLFNKELSLQHASQLTLNMSDRTDFLTDFYLDNEGQFVFGRGIRPSSSDNINKFYLVVKPAAADSFIIKELALDNIALDEVKLRMDNSNSRYLFTGFYYKKARGGNIEGICNAIFDKKQNDWAIKNVVPLDNDLRADARGENNIKNAFNDFYIRQIVIRKDGGFFITAESMYETSRGGLYNNPFNRWNFYNPWMSSWDYYRYSSLYGYGPYGGPFGSRYGSNTTRYNADNIVVCSFDKDGKMLLSNTIRKSQYDDESDAMISYQLVNTGGQLLFLYNDYGKRDVLLTYQAVDADGKISRPPTMRGLDKGYDFLPRYAKQVSGRQVIIPSLYRNYLVFAKLEF